MQAVVRGFLSQSAKMDPLEKVRRWQRSLDGYISFRKAVLIALCVFAFILYVGPSVISWLFFGSARGPGRADHFDGLQSCAKDKLAQIYRRDLLDGNARIRHTPWREGLDSDDLLYVGNGYFGLSHDDNGDWLNSKLFVRVGAQRVMRTLVDFSPLVNIKPMPDDGVGSSTSTTVLSYLKGLVHSVDCHPAEISVEQRVFAHGAIPGVLVQEVDVVNPSATITQFNAKRSGPGKIDEAITRSEVIGDQRYSVLKGVIKIEEPFFGFQSMRSPFVKGLTKRSKDQQYAVVAVVSLELKKTYGIRAQKTETLTFLTGLSCSTPLNRNQARESLRGSQVEGKALDAVKKALELDDLQGRHEDVWRSLWTTGFGISHSMAEGEVNGDRINATMYYTLSQAPTLLHSLFLSDSEKMELKSHLSYLEGCYGNLPTLHERKNLWRPLNSLQSVNDVVQYWFLNLEVNGCHNLLKAGADGVNQAMVLSFAGLKFRQHHLELDANPKDLHRDYFMRRVCYGNETHLNISVVVQDDNKPVIEVSLDRNNQDYYACDAGCLDRPVKLSSTVVRRFPVKLTDPVTAVLYVTADYEHMIELKHTIHVKGVVDAPAHEHHVMALHKHGNKLGGLPTIFWMSIGSLIFIFHVFLFKLIWQEYCSNGPDKYRTSKYV